MHAVYLLWGTVSMKNMYFHNKHFQIYGNKMLSTAADNTTKKTQKRCSLPIITICTRACIRQGKPEIP